LFFFGSDPAVLLQQIRVRQSSAAATAAACCCSSAGLLLLLLSGLQQHLPLPLPQCCLCCALHVALLRRLCRPQLPRPVNIPAMNSAKSAACKKGLAEM
jgi:hypothetical protein